MPERGPRLVDVARLAGVSPQSVSRVLRGSTRHASATRQRVLAAADVLGYEADQAARALANRRTPRAPGAERSHVPSLAADLDLLRRLARRVSCHPEVSAGRWSRELHEVAAACEALAERLDDPSR